MSKQERLISDRVLSILPLIYVGWADSVLSPSEMNLLHDKINALSYLDAEEAEILMSWSMPGYPPTQAQFQEWKSEMKKASNNLSIEDRRSLVDIGLAMARASTDYQNDVLWKSPKTRLALQEIQEALGLNNDESVKLLLSTIGVKDVFADKMFSLKGIHGLLDEPYSELKSQIRKLLRDPEFKLRHERNKDIHREKVLGWVKLLALQGYGGYAYPETYGGKDDTGKHIAVFEMLAYHDISLAVKFGVQFGLFGGAIFNLGSKKHHEAYMSKLTKGEILGCFAMTESGHGSNVKGLETTATYDADSNELIINSPTVSATKEYIGNALHCSHATVFAQLIVRGVNYGVHAIIVEIRNAEGVLNDGIKVEDCGYKMGLNGVDNGKLFFNQVRVPKENLLNRFGDIDENGNYSSPIKSDSKRFFTMLGTLVVGRISVAWAGVSAAKKALTIAIDYGLRRRQFSVKDTSAENLLLDYPTHQRRLMPLLAKTFALDFAMKKMTLEYVDGSNSDDFRRIESIAAGLKVFSSRNATDVIQECRECCGGMGYMANSNFADLKADTDVFSTFEGDNTVLLQLVAKGLISEFQKEFHDEGFMAVIRFLSRRVSTNLTEINPYQSRRTEESHLLDPGLYYHAFSYRAEKLLDTVAARLRRFLAQRISLGDAFLRCQNHLIVLANAHINLYILKSFYKVLDRVESEEEKKVLKRIYQLYALHNIESDRGWFLENDYMSGSKSKAIRRMVDKLCADLRKDAVGLVDCFSIPEELIMRY